jgi:hypothetical protein
MNLDESQSQSWRQDTIEKSHSLRFLACRDKLFGNVKNFSNVETISRLIIWIKRLDQEPGSRVWIESLDQGSGSIVSI